MRRLVEISCVFRIHLARLRAEAGPFLLAAIVFPSAMYLFARAVGHTASDDAASGLRFLAGSVVFSLSMTSISWLGYLLLENRFTGRLKLFATLPVAPSSYVLGVVVFGVIQAVVATVSLLTLGYVVGVPLRANVPALAAAVALTMLCLSGFSVVIASRARSFSEGSLMTDAFGAGLVFLAPVYYAPEAMPALLRLPCRWLPTACAARAVESSLSGAPFAGVDTAALAAMAAVTLALGFRLMRWRDA